MPDVRATSGGQGEARGLPYVWRQAGEDGAAGLLLTPPAAIFTLSSAITVASDLSWRAFMRSSASKQRDHAGSAPPAGYAALFFFQSPRSRCSGDPGTAE